MAFFRTRRSKMSGLKEVWFSSHLVMPWVIIGWSHSKRLRHITRGEGSPCCFLFLFPIWWLISIQGKPGIGCKHWLIYDHRDDKKSNDLLRHKMTGGTGSMGWSIIHDLWRQCLKFHKVATRINLVKWTGTQTMEDIAFGMTQVPMKLLYERFATETEVHPGTAGHWGDV